MVRITCAAAVHEAERMDDLHSASVSLRAEMENSRSSARSARPSRSRRHLDRRSCRSRCGFAAPGIGPLRQLRLLLFFARKVHADDVAAIVLGGWRRIIRWCVVLGFLMLRCDRLVGVGVPATLHVPFNAVTQFHDPAVEFALTFHANADELPQAEHEEAENDAPARSRRPPRTMARTSSAWTLRAKNNRSLGNN